MARVCNVPVSFRLWQQIATEGNVIEKVTTTRGLPEGAELVTSYYDGKRGEVVFMFHHDSFGDVPEGGHIPEIAIEFKKEYPESVPFPVQSA